MTSAPSIPATTPEASHPAPDVVAADADSARAYGEMRRLWLADEPSSVIDLIPAARLSGEQRERAARTMGELIAAMRRNPEHGRAAVLTHQLGLDTAAGLALLGLAEALLRVPDAPTADRLIRDKLAAVDWGAAGLKGPMATALQWASALVGPKTSAVAVRDALRPLFAPAVRWGARGAMRLIGGEFVFAQTIESALKRARAGAYRDQRFSFDMLGEAALTAEDAERYLRSYQHAIEAVGVAYRGRGPIAGGSVSVKLSALHPRYVYTQQRRIAELAGRLRQLCELAQRHDIALAIDAEEADRLELSLELIEALMADRALRSWSGLGVAVQAYQKRAPAVIDYLAHLARARPHRLMVRLVKGAYWDAEIKQAQMEGLPGYPVYTRKAHTDLAYLACARRLLEAGERLRPQFATHNAQTVAEILELAAEQAQPELEFQRLHGMGAALFEALRARTDSQGHALRVYAPVGPRRTLLPYLMRRLLENGAASSFVHRAARADSTQEYMPAVEIATRDSGPRAHPRIPLPEQLFAPERRNSLGIELADASERAPLEQAIAESRAGSIEIEPIVAASASAAIAAAVREHPGGGAAGALELMNPADRRQRIGSVRYAGAAWVDAALEAAEQGAPRWEQVPVERRAALLERAAELYEQNLAALVARVVLEAGRTLNNAVAEVREAVDFLRYYAAQIRSELTGSAHRPLGTVVCISPWNFPVAIFTGQIAAALAGGNVVIAKPAEQTSATAALAVRLLLEAGIPDFALQLLPGEGERVGMQLVGDARVQGVLLTGSTAAARSIARELAQRGDVPFVAETGGQNAMIVDSTALPEQVVTDVLRSAFDSAGQRCSALRVLCLQQEIAPTVLQMLEGAMRELRIGDPASIATDVGPLIDRDAQERIEEHLRRLQGRIRCQSPLSDECTHGTFVPPTLIDIDSIAELKGEVFGPVLHVMRFERRALSTLIDAVNATGFGLTLGIASRIDATRDEIVQRAHVGNVYVNRNVIGAVVGVQPFGGERLSGTGPKAGGPFYLHRLLRHSPGPTWPSSAPGRPPAVLATLIDWIERGPALQLGPIDREFLRLRAERYAQRTRLGARVALRGYVGESNELRLRARGIVRATARSPRPLLEQLAAGIATGNRLRIDDAPLAEALRAELPEPLRAWCGEADKEADAVLVDPAEAKQDGAWLEALRSELAAADGPIVPVIVGDEGYPLDRLLLEQTVTINTASVGGDPQLLSLED